MTDSGRTGELVVSAAAGAHAGELVGKSVPIEGSISGAVMKSAESLIFDDVSQDPRGFRPIISLGRHGPAFFVPLRIPGGVAGTLMVANLKGGNRFSMETRRLVDSLADAASVALDYDRAQTELRRLGLLEERERIAKELHDGIIQSLFAVGMGLQGTALTAGKPETSARIERAVEQLDGVGFQPGKNSAGSGLRNMRERAAKLGGTLTVKSEAGKGTTLQVSFPVQAE